MASKERYNSDPEYRARVLANCARYRERNRERLVEEARARRASDPEKYSQYAREYRAQNKDALKLRGRSYYQRNARAFVLRKFGITEADYDTMLRAQGGVCAVCGGPPRGRWAAYHVDHCHTGGHIRGLLCNRCNAGIGFFEDDPALLARAVDYLKKGTLVS